MRALFHNFHDLKNSDCCCQLETSIKNRVFILFHYCMKQKILFIFLICKSIFCLLIVLRYMFCSLQAVCKSNAGIFCAFHIRFRRCHFKRGKRTRFVLLRLVHVMIAISATRFNAHSSTTQDFPNNRNSTLNL